MMHYNDPCHIQITLFRQSNATLLPTVSKTQVLLQPYATQNSQPTNERYASTHPVFLYAAY
jgi:hypothetical protein